MEPIEFEGRIRLWDPQKGGGLAVVEVPEALVERFGGLRQQRVRGTIGGAAFSSSVMPAGGGRLAMSVSKAMMDAAGVAVGDEARVVVSGIGRV